MKILDVPQSGSVAGVTSSRNRFGQYRRTRAIPVQPRTPKQTTTRAMFVAGSSSWRTLSDVQRQGWNDYAAQLTRSDRLGSGYSPTGAALFTGSSVMAQVPQSTPPGSLPDFVLALGDFTYTDPTPGPEAFTVAVLSTSADNGFILETSGKVSPGITSAAAVRRWFSLPSSAGSPFVNQFFFTASPVSFLVQYNYLFASPQSGDVIWFRAREVAYPGGGATPITNRLFQTARFVTP